MAIQPDYRLSYTGSETTLWATGDHWVAQGGRDFDTDTRYGLMGPPHMIFGGENKATYQYYFNITSKAGEGVSVDRTKRILAGILGYAKVNGNQIQRTMPLRDPDGMGMVADRIVSATYVTPSGFTPILAELYGLPAFNEDFFTKIPSDRNFGDTAPGVPEQRSAALYNYLSVQVEFCHVPYPVLPDDAIGGDETKRYMFIQETSSNEYVQVPQGQVFFSEGGVPITDAVAPGGNWIRMIQTIVLDWHRLPVEAMPHLTQQWKELMGTVNDQIFTLNIYGQDYTFEPETMLFLPYKTKPRPVSPLGVLEYDAQLTWGWRGGEFNGTDITWNKFLYPPNAKYYAVGWKNAGGPYKKIYTPADHTSFHQW